MKCPYINPTVKQCMSCTLPDCVNDTLTADELSISDEIDEGIKDDNSTNQQRNFRRWYHNHLNSQRVRNQNNYQSVKDNPEYKARVSQNVKRFREKKTSESLERRAEKRIERLRKKREYNKAYYERKKAERVS